MSRVLRSALFGVLLGLPTAAFPQTLGPPISTWAPNGSVEAVSLDGHTLYVGGEFDMVGPVTGSFVTVDGSDPSAIAAGAAVADETFAIVADGAGGWFIATAELFGSTFQVLHVRADGTRDPAWSSPAFAGGTIGALALEGGRLFVAGGFTTTNGVARPGLVALDPSSGALLPWDARLIGPTVPTLPPFPASVELLAAVSGRLYVAGVFESAGGASRTRFAVLDAATGDALPGTLPLNTFVSGLAATTTRVFVRGNCLPAGYAPLCAYGLDMVPVPGWTFPPSSGLLLASPSALYSTESSTTGPPFGVKIVAHDLDTGVALPFAAPEAFGFPGVVINRLALAGNTLYFGGDFTTVNGQTRRRLAAVDATSGALLPWAPLVGGNVRALATAGGRVAVGGDFRVAGGVAKQNLVALDLRTGRPGVATPDLSFTVSTMLPVGDVMVAGGERPFGTSGPDLTAFVTANGTLLPWSLSSNGSVSTLATDGRRLYIGGRFSSLSGFLRLNLAAVDLGTAAVTAWNPEPNGAVTTLAVDGSTLFAGGAFSTLRGYGRRLAAAFDTGTHEVLSFDQQTSLSLPPTGFAFMPGRVLVAGGDVLQPYGVMPFTWLDRTSGAPVAPLGVTFSAGAAARFGGTTYVAGNTGTDAGALLGIDTVTGRTRTWDLAIALEAGFRGAIAVNGDYVAVGSALRVFSTLQKLVVYAAPHVSAPQQIQSTVTGNTVTLGWQPGAGPSTAYLVEAGTTAGGTNVGVFNVGLSTRVAGALAPGTYYIRVRGVGANGPGAASSEVIATVPPTSTAPAAPGVLSASVSHGVVTLTWGAAAGNATSYVIEAGTAAGLANIGALPTGHLDTTWSVAAPAGTYFVRVRAANAFGLSAPSNEATVVVAP